MPRHRFITSLLAVVLLAAGCGGGDDASAEPEGTQADGVSEVATSDTDQPDTTARDSTDQPDAGTEPEPEPAPVRLGDRFEWCVDTQRDWDRLAEIQGQVDAAEAALRDAQETLEAATDELDRAEALQVFESAERHVADLLPVFVDAAHEVVRSVRSGRRHREETEVIAVERAREAFYAAAAPALVELLGVTDAASSLYEEPVIALEPASETTIPAEPEPAGEALPPEELLRALQELQDEVYNLQLDVSGVRGQAEGAIGDIRRAENPTEALAARAAGREGLQALDEIDSAAWEAGRITQELESAYLDSVWRARDAGAISQEEHESARTTWYEAVQGISRLTTFIHDRADRRQHHLIPLGNAALEEAANVFVLTDPAWAAFQMSLSESCQL